MQLLISQVRVPQAYRTHFIGSLHAEKEHAEKVDCHLLTASTLILARYSQTPKLLMSHQSIE